VSRDGRRRRLEAGYRIIPRVSLDHSKRIADGNLISFPEFPQGGMITCKMVNGDLYASPLNRRLSFPSRLNWICHNASPHRKDYQMYQSVYLTTFTNKALPPEWPSKTWRRGCVVRKLLTFPAASWKATFVYVSLKSFKGYS